jgi:hypothetical protein
MGMLYEDSNEETLHSLAIEALADEMRQPIERVRAVYERELSQLKAGARVKEYLALFSMRRAREALLRER